MNTKLERWRMRGGESGKHAGMPEGAFREVKEWTDRAAASYQELARIFSAYVTKKEAFTLQDKQRIFEHVSEQLCRGCMKRSYCWERNSDVSCEAFRKVMTDLRDSRIDLEGLPEFFRNNCICPQELLEELNFGISVEHMRLAAFNQMMEGREALVQQLKETANYITNLPGQLRKEISLGNEVKKELRRELRRYHVKLCGLQLLERRGRGRQLKMRLKCDSGRSVSVRLVERLLSEKFEREVREINRWERLISEEEREMIFEEQPEYFTMTGVTRLAKQEEEN